MTIQDAIRQRHSVRSYSERPVEKEKLEALQALVDEYNQQSGLHIQLVTSDPTAFDSRMAHYGKFSGISNYLAMIGPKSDELPRENRLSCRTAPAERQMVARKCFVQRVQMSTEQELVLHKKSFRQLTTDELYELLRVRTR